MDGDFFIGAALSSTLTKLALRYINLVNDPKKQNVSTIYNKLLIVKNWPKFTFHKRSLFSYIFLSILKICFTFEQKLNLIFAQS